MPPRSPDKPLRRITPLQARTALTRTAPMPPKKSRAPLPASDLPKAPRPARKAPRNTGFPPAVRRAVRERAQHRCEACGRYLNPEEGNLQHRCARKAGGRGRRHPWINSAANASLLCGTPVTLCHGEAESRSPRMYEAGFWLKEGESPLDRPIQWHFLRADGRQRWLTGDGEYSGKAPERGSDAA